MATRIKEGMTGAEVAQIIDNGFDNLEELNQRVETNETILDGLASKENLIIPTDEEDITSESGTLKFKDREYDEANFSGKGYKILRKNIQDGKNVLTLDMINESDCIYEIRYDFDLNSQTINIPNNSVLKFEGGKFINGRITANKGNIFSIININNNIIFDNIIIYSTAPSSNRNFIINNIAESCWFENCDNYELYNYSQFNGINLTKDIIFKYINVVGVTANNLVPWRNFIINGNGHNIIADSDTEINGGSPISCPKIDDNISIILNNLNVNLNLQNTPNNNLYTIIKDFDTVYVNNCVFKSANRIITDCKNLYINDSEFYTNHFAIEGGDINKIIINSTIIDNIFYVKDSEEDYNRIRAGFDKISLINLTDERQGTLIINSCYLYGGIECDKIDEINIINTDMFYPSVGRRGDDYKDKNRILKIKNSRFIGLPYKYTEGNVNYNYIHCFETVELDNNYFNPTNIEFVLNMCFVLGLLYFKNIDNLKINQSTFIIDYNDKFSYVYPDFGFINCNSVDINNCIFNGKEHKFYIYVENSNILESNYKNTISNNGYITNVKGTQNNFELYKLLFNVYFGDTSTRPTINNVGFIYFDTTLNKPIWWNGTKWVDYNGNDADAKTSGTTAQRPSDVITGFQYFDTDINSPVYWNGTEWIKPATDTGVKVVKITLTEYDSLEPKDPNTLYAIISDSTIQ